MQEGYLISQTDGKSCPVKFVTLHGRSRVSHPECEIFRFGILTELKKIGSETEFQTGRRVDDVRWKRSAALNFIRQIIKNCPFTYRNQSF